MSTTMRELDVQAAAADAPERTALVAGDRTWTWRDVWAAVRSKPAPTGPVHLVPALDVESVIAILTAIHHGCPLVLGDAAMEVAGRPDPCAVDRGADGLLAIPFTSGTTQRPKGVRLTRGAFLAACAASADNLGWREDDRWLLTLPPAHVGGLSVLVRALIARRTVVLHSGSRAAPDLMRRMVEDRVTIASFVPTLVRRLVQERHTSPPSLRAALVGGAPASRSLLKDARALGFPVLPTYGMTETCAQVATRTPGDDRDADDVGRPLGDNEISFAGDGEILIRGPQLFRGYLGGPDRTGAFATGDLGSMDEAGRLVVEGRKDELIITGGENVSPRVVEAALLDTGLVEEAFVFGLPDDEWGQVVAALLVGAAPQEAVASASETLKAHERVRRWRSVAALPRTASGKVDRHAILAAWTVG